MNGFCKKRFLMDITAILFDELKTCFMKLKCIVIDDDPLICDLVQHFCSKVSTIEYCIACENAMNGLNLLSTQSFDILFLDYNMPDIDGKSLLELKKDKAHVVMVTSHEAFAVDSYNYPQIVDFMVKPISFERFYRAIQRVEGLIQANSIIAKNNTITNKPAPETIFVKDGNKLVQIHLNQLKYIKSESNYVLLVQEHKKIMSLIRMRDLEEKLPSNFIRVHRSYMVNLHYLESITPEEITINGQSIPIGTKYRAALKEVVGQL
jgi:two-component system, LytTR family, response regulator